MMNASTIAGPACSAAACPVITKMPPPITAPMPSAVSPHGPRVRRNCTPPWTSSAVVASPTGLRASNCPRMVTTPPVARAKHVPTRRTRQDGKPAKKSGGPEGPPRTVAPSHHFVQRVRHLFRRHLAALVAVQAVKDQPDRRPHHEHHLGDDAEVDEQQQAAGDSQRT